jgi:cytochrome oxidase Cu insertion factor (SCO1/SenC/PrrC family)
MASSKNQRILWTVLVLALAGIGIFALRDYMKSQEITEPSRIIPTMGAVPAFELVTHEGKPFSSSSLNGQYWIVDLIFTNCGGTCPILTANMASLQKALAKAYDVQLVSISVDPNNDTPEVLAEYAKRYNADTKNWTFLTGKVSTIYTIAKDGFKLTVDSVSGDTQNPIVHSERFVLVDKQGAIRGFYDGTTNETQSKILHDLGDLMREERQQDERL